MKANNYTAAEAAKMKAEALWLREFRTDFLGLPVREFAKLCGLSDKAVNDMENIKEPITPGIQRIIEHKTGFKFMQPITADTIVLEKKPEQIPETKPYPCGSLTDKRVKGDAVTEWMRMVIKTTGLSQSLLAKSIDKKESDIRDIIYAAKKLSPDIMTLIMVKHHIERGPHGELPMVHCADYVSDGVHGLMSKKFLKPKDDCVPPVQPEPENVHLPDEPEVVETPVLAQTPAEQVAVMQKGWGSPFAKDLPFGMPGFVIEPEKPKPNPEPEQSVTTVKTEPVRSYTRFVKGEQSCYLQIDYIAGSLRICDDQHESIPNFDCCKNTGEAIDLAEAILAAVKSAEEVLKK